MGNTGTFKVYHDDTQDNVVSRISANLAMFGLTIKDVDGGDGWQEYQIVREGGPGEVKGFFPLTPSDLKKEVIEFSITYKYIEKEK